MSDKIILKPGECEIEPFYMDAPDGSPGGFHGYKCSSCGYHKAYYKEKALLLESFDFRFCPHCGAKVVISYGQEITRACG